MFSNAKGKIEKVPSNEKEALSSDLMSFWEKKNCKNFFSFVDKFDNKNTKTWEGVDCYKQPFSVLVKKFDLAVNTVDFIGHAVALYTNDEFLLRPAVETVDRVKLYMDS